jgi:hypothetical protein
MCDAHYARHCFQRILEKGFFSFFYFLLIAVMSLSAARCGHASGASSSSHFLTCAFKVPLDSTQLMNALLKSKIGKDVSVDGMDILPVL